MILNITPSVYPENDLMTTVSSPHIAPYIYLLPVLIGEVTGSGTFTVSGIDNREVIWVTIEELKEAWQKPLRW